MNPFKAKDLIPDVIGDLPLELGEDLSEFYWNSIRSLLTGLNHYHVRIPNLGSFHVKGSILLREEINRLEEAISGMRRNPPRTAKRYAMYMEAEKKITALKKLLDTYNTELSLRKANERLRKQIRDAKDNLEAQKTDP